MMTGGTPISGNLHIIIYPYSQESSWEASWSQEWSFPTTNDMLAQPKLRGDMIQPSNMQIPPMNRMGWTWGPGFLHGARVPHGSAPGMSRLIWVRSEVFDHGVFNTSISSLACRTAADFMGHLGSHGTCRPNVMAMDFTMKKDMVGVSEHGVEYTSVYLLKNSYFDRDNRDNQWIHRWKNCINSGWSSSKVLNFMTTLKSHMNTTTLSKEVWPLTPDIWQHLKHPGAMRIHEDFSCPTNLAKGGDQESTSTGGFNSFDSPNHSSRTRGPRNGS